MIRKQACKGIVCPRKLIKILSVLAVCCITGLDLSASPPQSVQDYLLSGVVRSAEDNSPLPGASVIIKEGTLGTTADENGRFSLETKQSRVTLTVSFVGFLALDTVLHLPLPGDLVITLQQDANLLEAAVVKGYYTTTKAFNTGSVSTVDGDVLARQPVGDPIMALQGRVPGLYITQLSGVPGASLEVSLRGQNSIANGNAPLYIVDGVPFTSESLTLIRGGGIAISPFSSIPINNIEQIDVLKDADATAIYGSRGANGVILITTKKGKPGRTQVSVDFNQGFGRIVNGYDLMNTRQYLALRKEALANDGVAVGTADYDLNGTWATNRYTDWEEVLIGGTSRLTDANLTFSGGTKYTRFLIAGGYRRETTVFPGDYRNRKISLRSNITHASTDNRFNSSFSVVYMNDNNRLPNEDFTSDIDLPPNAPAIYENGSLNWVNSTWDNPFARLINSSTSVTSNLNGSLNLSYELIRDVRLNGRFGYNNIRLETENLSHQAAIRPSYTFFNARQNATGDNKIESWVVEPWVSFHRTVSKGVLDAVAGLTFEENQQYGVTVLASGFSSDALVGNVEAAPDASIGRTVFNRYRYNAIFARAGYTLLDRYVVNLTGRRDGSSRFGPGRRFGNFGAIGVAWIFSREHFVQSMPFIDFGKLKLSYGVTGNDQIGSYQYLSTYEPSNYSYQGLNGLNPVRQANADFGWETVRKMEAGLELGVLENRLYFELNWYRNRTDNQLVGYPLSNMTGFGSVQANLPAIVQNSGVEVNVGAQISKRNQFSWSASGNLTIPRNKLIAYPDIEASSYANRYVIGRPLSLLSLYQYTGLDRENGIYMFEDINNDGLITSSEDKIHVFSGQRYFGGVNNRLAFHGIELNIFFQFTKRTGRLLRPGGTYPGNFSPSGANMPEYYLDRWRQDGDVGPFQKATQASGDAADAYYNYLDSDATVLDGSFIRLKNISVSWSLPREISAKIGIADLKVYTRAQNIFTITNFQGPDPEQIVSYSLPPLRMITAGVRLSIM